jgi:hypothetical protein
MRPEPPLVTDSVEKGGRDRQGAKKRRRMQAPSPPFRIPVRLSAGRAILPLYKTGVLLHKPPEILRVGVMSAPLLQFAATQRDVGKLRAKPTCLLTRRLGRS